MVEMINKRATIMANRCRFFKKPDENLYNHFNQILHKFEKATAQDPEQFEKLLSVQHLRGSPH